MTGVEPHWSDGTANSAATKVPGRKAMVMTAMTFIELLSDLAAFAKAMFAKASFRVIKLKSYSVPLAAVPYELAGVGRNLPR